MSGIHMPLQGPSNNLGGKKRRRPQHLPQTSQCFQTLNRAAVWTSTVQLAVIRFAHSTQGLGVQLHRINTSWVKKYFLLLVLVLIHQFCVTPPDLLSDPNVHSLDPNHCKIEVEAEGNLKGAKGSNAAGTRFGGGGAVQQIPTPASPLFST